MTVYHKTNLSMGGVSAWVKNNKKKICKKNTDKKRESKKPAKKQVAQYYSKNKESEKNHKPIPVYRYWLVIFSYRKAKEILTERDKTNRARVFSLKITSAQTWNWVWRGLLLVCYL
jgi:hypothetical protein